MQVALALEVIDVDRELFEIAQRVLEQRVGEGVAGEQLRHEQRRAQLLAFGHRRRERDIPEALAGRQQRFAVGVDQERVRVERCRAVIGAPIEDDPAVGLIREQVDRMADVCAGVREQAGQLLQGRVWVDLAGRVVRRVDDDRAGARADCRGDRGQVEIEGQRIDLTRTGCAPAAAINAS